MDSYVNWWYIECFRFMPSSFAYIFKYGRSNDICIYKYEKIIKKTERIIVGIKKSRISKQYEWEEFERE